MKLTYPGKYPILDEAISERQMIGRAIGVETWIRHRFIGGGKEGNGGGGACGRLEIAGLKRGGARGAQEGWGWGRKFWVKC